MTKLKLPFTSLALALPLLISGCGHDSPQTDNMMSNSAMATNQSQMNSMTSNAMNNMGHMGSNSMNMAGSSMNDMTSNHMNSPQTSSMTPTNQSK